MTPGLGMPGSQKRTSSLPPSSCPCTPQARAASPVYIRHWHAPTEWPAWHDQVMPTTLRYRAGIMLLALLDGTEMINQLM